MYFKINGEEKKERTSRNILTPFILPKKNRGKEMTQGTLSM